MSSIVFTYTCGAPKAGPEVMLCLNDLLQNRKGPLRERVGLGRLLSLPYLLGTSIELHVPDERDLLDPADQQLVAVILAGTGSELRIAGKRIGQNEKVFPAWADLAPLAWESNSTLGTISNTDDESGKNSAVRDLAYALLREVELTGTQAAHILNAIPVWRHQTAGIHGHTGPSMNAAARRSRRDDRNLLGKNERRINPIWWIDEDVVGLEKNWGEVVKRWISAQTLMFFTPTALERVKLLTTNQRTILDALTEYNNDPANDYASRADRSDDTNEGRRSTLAAACWFTRDVTTGAFLNPCPYPPAQLEQAAAYISDPDRSKMKLRALALALNNAGFLTVKRTGEWNAGTVKTLREGQSATSTQVGV